jgi:hypothetical protein
MLRRRMVGMVRREYTIPVESFEKALLNTHFHVDKTTSMTTHFRRKDGMHVILSSVRMKEQERWYTYILADGTIMRKKEK